MSLNEFQFIMYFIPFFGALVLLQGFKRVLKKQENRIGKVQLVLLLLFSYLFVVVADGYLTMCIMFATLISYVVGIKIETAETIENRHFWLLGGVSTLLLLLCYFKYCNFFLRSFSKLVRADSIALKITLPLGISFYVFTAISYLMDVYREKYKAERSLFNVALYISFFPKLTAGPIIRGSEFLPQIKNYGGITIQNFQTGIQIFVFGLFKKIVLADHLSVFVDDVYYSVSAFHTVTVLLAVISYSLQIYYDFSGYSDMAIGIAKMVGFDFSRNFNLPYIAENISDFWKRWHISLSSWFQEYLYYSLGGSRKGKRRTYFNLVIVMLLSGLWHGAGVTFIVWGLLYGISNCIYKAWKTHRCKNSLKQETVSPIISGVAKLGRITGNFIIVTLFWVVFRAENLRNAVDVWKALFIWHDGIVQIYSWSIFAIVCLIAATIMAFRKAAREGKKYVDGYYPVMDLSRFGSLVVFFTFVGLTIMMGYFGNNAFIYGRF